jgi:uncharacterized protein (DUF433 family)
MPDTSVVYAHETKEGGWRIADTRVSLDSLVAGYWEGRSPEAIAEEFPSLTIEQVYGAIAFYLRNRPEIDDYLLKQGARWQEMETRSKSQHGSLTGRLRSNSSPHGSTKAS